MSSFQIRLPFNNLEKANSPPSTTTHLQLLCTHLFDTSPLWSKFTVIVLMLQTEAIHLKACLQIHSTILRASIMLFRLGKNFQIFHFITSAFNSLTKIIAS